VRRPTVWNRAAFNFGVVFVGRGGEGSGAAGRRLGVGCGGTASGSEGQREDRRGVGV
jgi:hypothetical protein